MNSIEAKRMLGVVADLCRFSYYNKRDYFNAMPNPDLILQKLGANPVVYKELLTDPHVFSCVQSRISGVSSMLWKINYNQFTEDNSKEYINFLDAIFEKLNIDELIKQMMDAVLFGYSVFEIIWKFENNKLIPTKIIQRPNEYFEFNKAGQCLLKTTYEKDLLLTEDKFLVVKHDASNENPYGIALLGLCYWPVFFKKQTIKLWSKATDKNADNFLKIKVNESSNITETETIVDYILNQYYTNNIAVCNGEGADVETLNNINSNPALFTTFINFQNSEISKAILSQTGTTENTSSVGSYAMSKTHFAIREDVIQSDCKMLMPIFDKLIYYITLYNYPQELNKRPYFELYAPYKIDNDLIERDLKLYQLGIRFDKKYISSTYNISENVFEIENNTNYGMFSNNKNNLLLGNKNIKNFDDKETNKKDDAPAQLKELEHYINNDIYKKIKETIDNYEGEDFDELENILINEYPNLPTNEITEYLEKLIMYNQWLGEANV